MCNVRLPRPTQVVIVFVMKEPNISKPACKETYSPCFVLSRIGDKLTYNPALLGNVKHTVRGAFEYFNTRNDFVMKLTARGDSNAFVAAD